LLGCQGPQPFEQRRLPVVVEEGAGHPGSGCHSGDGDRPAVMLQVVEDGMDAGDAVETTPSGGVDQVE
jgi:hypothetical protein